jgi:hypothetical protein
MIGIMRWLFEHGKDTLESLGVVCGLFFTAASLRADARERRITNLMEIVHSHRELWLELIEKPELARTLKSDVDLQKNPITVVEERFVHLLVIHLSVAFVARKSGMLPSLSRLEDDVGSFFSLPIPRQVWKWSLKFQEKDFVDFVERAVRLTDQPL